MTPPNIRHFTQDPNSILEDNVLESSCSHVEILSACKCIKESGSFWQVLKNLHRPGKKLNWSGFAQKKQSWRICNTQEKQLIRICTGKLFLRTCIAQENSWSGFAQEKLFYRICSCTAHEKNFDQDLHRKTVFKNLHRPGKTFDHDFH